MHRQAVSQTGWDYLQQQFLFMDCSSMCSEPCSAHGTHLHILEHAGFWIHSVWVNDGIISAKIACTANWWFRYVNLEI